MEWVIGIESEAWPIGLSNAVLSMYLGALFFLLWEAWRRERKENVGVDDPPETRFRNWLEDRRQCFTPWRGLKFLVIGLAAFSSIVAILAVADLVASVRGAIDFVAFFSVLAGGFGLFDNRRSLAP